MSPGQANANVAVLEAMLRGVEANARVVSVLGDVGRLLQLSSEQVALVAAITALKATESVR